MSGNVFHDGNAAMEFVSESSYHADLLIGDKPRLSKSRAHRLLSRSAAHVKAEHPILNPDWVAPEPEAKFDLGNAVHALVLEQNEDILFRVEAKDWTTKVAKAERDDARIAGKIPMLADQHDRVMEMVEAFWAQLPLFQVEPPLFKDGSSEVTMLWRCHRGVDWKARLDWLVKRNDVPVACHDLKTTKATAAPEAWSKSMVSFGADMQSVIYREGIRAVFEVDVPLTFVAVETYPPYAMSVHDLAPTAEHLARQRVDDAAAIWKRCLDSGVWPSYPTKVCYAEAPGYAETNHYERMYRDEEPS